MTMENKEHKIIGLELKSLTEDGMFEGYGSIFGNKDSYGDVVNKGAFASSLQSQKSQNIKLLWQHDTTEPIGVYQDVHEDDKGLYVKGQLLINDIVKAREAYALMKAGAINGLSIGYTVNQGGSEWNKNGTIRYLNDLSLWEISIVTFPANPKAIVSDIKEQNMKIENVRDFENFLRESGIFSKTQAIAIASKGYVAGLRDSGAPTDEVDHKLSQDILAIMETLKTGVKSI